MKSKWKPKVCPKTTYYQKRIIYLNHSQLLLVVGIINSFNELIIYHWIPIANSVGTYALKMAEKKEIDSTLHSVSEFFDIASVLIKPQGFSWK